MKLTAELLKDIERQLESMPDYSQLQLNIKKHVGMFNEPDAVKMTSVKYTDNEPNVTATTDIYKLIKTMADAKASGQLTFSLKLKNGKAEQLLVQDFSKL